MAQRVKRIEVGSKLNIRLIKMAIYVKIILLLHKEKYVFMSILSFLSALYEDTFSQM
jgi:hypothetical protein